MNALNLDTKRRIYTHGVKERDGFWPGGNFGSVSWLDYPVTN
jgi:hypothetical protein